MEKVLVHIFNLIAISFNFFVAKFRNYIFTHEHILNIMALVSNFIASVFLVIGAYGKEPSPYGVFAGAGEVSSKVTSDIEKRNKKRCNRQIFGFISLFIGFLIQLVVGCISL